jgi:hypothetical protein
MRPSAQSVFVEGNAIYPVIGYTPFLQLIERIADQALNLFSGIFNCRRDFVNHFFKRKPQFFPVPTQ